MRAIAFVASVTAPLLANAQSGETVKFDCDVAHIHTFKSDGMPFQAIEKDTKAQYVIAVGRDSIRADRKSSRRDGAAGPGSRGGRLSSSNAQFE